MQVRPWLNLVDKEFVVVQQVLVLHYSSVQVSVRCMPVGFRVVFKMVAPHPTAFHNVPLKCPRYGTAVKVPTELASGASCICYSKHGPHWEHLW
jgi:hypothetical protein